MKYWFEIWIKKEIKPKSLNPKPKTPSQKPKTKNNIPNLKPNPKAKLNPKTKKNRKNQQPPPLKNTHLKNTPKPNPHANPKKNWGRLI